MGVSMEVLALMQLNKSNFGRKTEILGLPQGLLGASHKDFPVNSSREALRKVWRSSGAAFCLLWGLPLETPIETFMEILTRIPMGSCIKTS